MIKGTDDENPICRGNLLLDVNHGWHHFVIEFSLRHFGILACVVFQQLTLIERHNETMQYAIKDRNPKQHSNENRPYILHHSGRTPALLLITLDIRICQIDIQTQQVNKCGHTVVKDLVTERYRLRSCLINVHDIKQKLLNQLLVDNNKVASSGNVSKVLLFEEPECEEEETDVDEEKLEGGDAEGAE